VAFDAVNVKVPVTVVSALIVSVQGDVPEQPPPLHPVNDEPGSATGVKVTVVPIGKLKSSPQAVWQ
jgi:hypothetical protein